MTLDLGFLIRETDAEYRRHAKARLSSHALATFKKCPLLYQKERDGLIPDEDRPAYFLGRATHTLVLEGREQYEAAYAIGGPINERTGKPFGQATKAWQEWSEAQGKPVLSHDQADLIEILNAAVHHHPLAAGLLADGEAEGVVRTEYCGVPCQSRIDWIHPERGLVDFKTADNLSWFESEAKAFGYVHQLAFYRSMVEQVTGVALPVYLIAVEKREPYRCGVWLLGDNALAIARQENEAAIRRLQRAWEIDAFPTGYEDIRLLDFV